MNYKVANSESGWTSYLENSYISSQCASAKYKGDKFVDERRIKDVGEDDLSMVSDASSGPPLFHKDEYNSKRNDNAATSKEATLLRKNTRTEKGRTNQCPKIQKQSSSLDDTASSSVFNFSNNNADGVNSKAYFRPNVLDVSQGYSSTQ